MLSTKLKEAAGNSADATLYVDDVFSTYLYTGTGAALTITNGIDLAGKGGLVWIKSRSNAYANTLFDTARGATNAIFSNTTDANSTLLPSLTAFNSNGFSLGAQAVVNGSGATFASWTFRKAAKFFDVVTYTGTGSARTIAHSLGVAPGMVIVKRTDTTGDWQVYSNGLTSAAYSIQLNSNSAQASAPTVWNSTAPTSSVFSVGTDATVNASGGTYVAYLYAHDTSSTGIIQCGTFTTDGSGNATVNLGWEPQYVMLKTSAIVDGWYVLDKMRGWLASAGTGYDAQLNPNTANAETGGNGPVQPTATGFQSVGGSATRTYIYMAIRMPNKPPTTGTQVFTNSLANPSVSVSCGFVPDMAFSNTRTSTGGVYTGTRLQGNSVSLNTYNAAAEAAFGWVWNGISTTWMQTSLGSPVVDWIFARSPTFMDIVCYTGTGSATTQAHNLTVAPELMMVKERSAANVWWVYDAINGNTKYMGLNSTAVPTTSATAWNNTTPTASVFSIGTGANVNASSQTFVAYLFATLAGISKVGSYTGNGTGQAIACGFSAGARFVLIKRTDAAGAWYTFDSARGLTSGSSPYLLLNSNAAEVTGNNGVYASTGGFTLGATASTTTNINAATYIFLAVA